MTITLTDENKAKVKASCQAMQHKHETTVTSPTSYTLKKETDYGGMSPLRRSNQDRGISEVAARLIMASWRNGSKKQYSTFITEWQNFCNQRQVNYIQPSFVCP